MALSDDIAVLYGLPLDEFTPARNDLARRLRGEKRREDAAEVAGLRKPTAAAWVVNQLVRERPDEARALLAAANEIRAGSEDGDARFRASVDGLARGAREILAASGRTPSDQVIQEVVTTLRAIAATEPEALETGRLTQGREASGFDALAGAAPKLGPRRDKQRAVKDREKPRSARQEARPPSVDRAAVDAARKALASARTEARELRRVAVAAEREAERARVAHERAATRVTTARAELDAARGASHAG
jgi:hypothetical protein